MSKLLLALAASSALVLAAATPALAQLHKGWDTTEDSHQGNSTNDCNNVPNGCTVIVTEQPKGQATDPPKENNSPKDITCKPTSPPGQCR
jgi:hypothetical protein